MISIKHFTDDELQAWCVAGVEHHTKPELIQLVESLLSRLSESEDQSIKVDKQAGNFQEELNQCTREKLELSQEITSYLKMISNLEKQLSVFVS